MRRIDAYLDVSPYRRRVRLALGLLVICAVVYLWAPAIARAVSVAKYHIYSQLELNEFYEQCGPGELTLISDHVEGTRG